MAQRNKHRKLDTIILQGAALDTSNLGCSALSLSVIFGIKKRLPEVRVAVADFGRGFRTRTLTNDGANFDITLFGSVNTRRIYRTDSIYGMAFCSTLGGLGHPVIRLYRDAIGVLDISGGDSFSDIYGLPFFRANTLRKKLALRESKSLILLPQTYGPYDTAYAQQVARAIVRDVAMAWARDDHSYEILRELAGDAFDPRRYRVGVDVAFALPPTLPSEAVTSRINDWSGDASVPLVGLNVSGLLLNRPEHAAEQYRLKANYGEVLLALIRRILGETNARVLLIPHVVCPPGHYESDIEACEAIAAEIRRDAPDRVAVAPTVQDPREAKWIIAQCDWFCGTRMHSCIAGLSSGVATAAISYSAKTLGVFETCGQGACVADPRSLGSEEVVDVLWTAWTNRHAARESLRAALPPVLHQAEKQMDEVVAACIGNDTA